MDCDLFVSDFLVLKLANYYQVFFFNLEKNTMGLKTLYISLLK